MTDIQEGNPYLQIHTPSKENSRPKGASLDTTEAGVSSADFRQVFLNRSSENDQLEYCSNVVITSKYTMWTFLPIFLFESFKKV